MGRHWPGGVGDGPGAGPEPGHAREKSLTLVRFQRPSERAHADRYTCEYVSSSEKTGKPAASRSDPYLARVVLPALRVAVMI